MKDHQKYICNLGLGRPNVSLFSTKILNCVRDFESGARVLASVDVALFLGFRKGMVLPLLLLL